MEKRYIILNDRDLSEVSGLKNLLKYTDKEELEKNFEEVKKKFLEKESIYPLRYKIKVPIKKLIIQDPKENETEKLIDDEKGNVTLNFNIRIQWDSFKEDNTVYSVYIDDFEIKRGKRTILKEHYTKIKNILRNELPIDEAIDKTPFISKRINELKAIKKQREEMKEAAKLAEAMEEYKQVKEVLKTSNQLNEKNEHLYRLSRSLYIVTDKKLEDKEIEKFRNRAQSFDYERALYGSDREQEKTNKKIIEFLKANSKKYITVTIPFEHTWRNTPYYRAAIHDSSIKEKDKKDFIASIKFKPEYKNGKLNIKYFDENGKEIQHNNNKLKTNI